MCGATGCYLVVEIQRGFWTGLCVLIFKHLLENKLFFLPLLIFFLIFVAQMSVRCSSLTIAIFRSFFSSPWQKVISQSTVEKCLASFITCLKTRIYTSQFLNLDIYLEFHLVLDKHWNANAFMTGKTDLNGKKCIQRLGCLVYCGVFCKSAILC